MTVEDVFHIQGRGTVLTGRLEGNFLSVGDTLICDGQQWPVKGLEKFRELLETAQPGDNIGVLIGRGPRGDLLRGRRVVFVPGLRAAQRPAGPGRHKRLWRRRG